jgi:hypothetical protein
MNQKKHHLGSLIEEESFSLIAIHTSLEDFQLAYFINQKCATRFKRNHSIYSSHLKRSVDVMIWENSWNEETYWYLFANRYVKEQKTNSEQRSLFEDEILTEHYLLPELKHVNYFIKKPDEETNNSLLKKIQTLSEIQIAYCIPEKDIKSTKNIIFD